MSMESLKRYVEDSKNVKEAVLKDDALLNDILTAAEMIVSAYKEGGRVFAAGNGGSAADAQHFAAELVGRFLFDRAPLAAEALSTDTSAITAIGNDYGYEHIFSRQLAANASNGDVFAGISTSGSSKNILNALEKAKELGVKSIGLTGAKPSAMDTLCNVVLKAPSEFTPHIQETHIMIIHIICKIIEERLFLK